MLQTCRRTPAQIISDSELNLELHTHNLKKLCVLTIFGMFIPVFCAYLVVICIINCAKLGFVYARKSTLKKSEFELFLIG